MHRLLPLAGFRRRGYILLMRVRKPPDAFGRWLLWLAALAGVIPAVAAPATAQWTNGPLADPHFFPIAVWLQDPAQAEAYRQVGINTYVGLWEGPTEDQLTVLKKAGLRVVCLMNDVGRKHFGDPTIIAWMHGDEPDNAPNRGARFGFGSPISPATIVADYRRIKAADPSRPILLNLGQGAAWDGWYGRGRRNHHPEDYPEYLKGCDIASFDIYPVNSVNRNVQGNLGFVARGVDRLIQWTGTEKPVWNCIECTAITDPRHRPSPEQVRTEVWMALIHGSRGIIYFVHRFKPVSDYDALLHDPEMLAAVGRINHQIAQLAPVLNSPTVPEGVGVRTEDPEAVSAMIKESGVATYLFAVEMRGHATDAAFTLPRASGGNRIEVLGEDRTLMVTNNAFRDHFAPWAVHFYRQAHAR